MANLGFQGLGNGLGYLYIVQGADIRTLINDSKGRNSVLSIGLTAGPASGETIAVGSTTITGFAGTITSVTINGVNVMSAAAVGGASASAIATGVAQSINTSGSIPGYSAVAVSNKVFYYALPGTGSGPNGFVVISTATTGTTTVDSNMEGGSPASGVYDPIYGFQFFIDDNPNTATIGSLTTAVEITANIITRSLTTPVVKQTATLSGQVLSMSRISSIQNVAAAQGSAGMYGVINMPNAQDGDEIIISSPNSDVPYVIQDLSISTAVGANILLNNQVTYTSKYLLTSLTLQYSASLNQWVELSRSPGIVISTSAFRTAGLAYPVDGVTATAITLGGATVVFTAGSSKKYEQITGTGTLTGSSSFTPATGAKDGDSFFIDYFGTVVYSGGFTITIAGITLTATQALNGNTTIEAYYSATAGAWFARIYQASPVDLATVVQLATKESALGNPSINGWVLSSSTTGVRTWVPNASSPVYYTDSTSTATGANTTPTVLKTYVVPAATLVNPGDALEIDAVITCGASANNKTIVLSYGATTIWTSSASAFNGEVLIVKARVVVVTGTTQSANAGTIGANVIPVIPQFSAPAETISGNVTINITGTNGTATANDIVCKQLTVKVVRHI